MASQSRIGERISQSLIPINKIWKGHFYAMVNQSHSLGVGRGDCGYDPSEVEFHGRDSNEIGSCAFL